jgi:hypothetical protein
VDTDLIGQAKATLGRLRMLSGVSAVQYHAGGTSDNATAPGLRTRPNDPLPARHGGHAEGEMPPGVRMTLERSTGAPSLRFDPAGHFLHRMQAAIKAADEELLRWLVLQAERYRQEELGIRKLVTHANHDDAVAELIGDYVGVRAVQAAAELCPSTMTSDEAVTWVRKHRFLNRCDPEFGEPNLGDETVQKIRRMKLAGASSRVIAGEVHVSFKTVCKIINGEQVSTRGAV